MHGFKWIAIKGVELLILSCEKYEIFKINRTKIYIQWLLMLVVNLIIAFCFKISKKRYNIFIFFCKGLSLIIIFFFFITENYLLKEGHFVYSLFSNNFKSVQSAPSTRTRLVTLQTLYKLNRTKEVNFQHNYYLPYIN